MVFGDDSFIHNQFLKIFFCINVDIFFQINKVAN